MRVAPYGWLSAFLLVVSSCEAMPDEPGAGGVDVIIGEEGKADATDGVEVTDWLSTQQPTASGFSPSTSRRGFVFFATAGTNVDVEVTQKGSSAGLDTILKIHGPRNYAGKYDTTLDEDDDSGFGKLSRLRGVEIPAEGFYLAEVSLATAPTANKRIRVTLGCSEGTCDRPGPINFGYDVRWTERSAEYRALAHQAYTTATIRLDEMAEAGLDGDWAVSLDLDETVLSNVTYQIERGAPALATRRPAG